MMSSANASALLVLDVQNDIVDPKGKVGAGGLAKIVAERHILTNLKELIARVRAKAWPVVYVGLAYREDYEDVLSVAARIAKARETKVAIRGSWGSEFHPDIGPQPGDQVFHKQWVNPFFGTPLLEWLRRSGINNLYLTGTATNLVVESAARYADDAGFASSRTVARAPIPLGTISRSPRFFPFGRVITSKEVN
jgi:nicotinamidase-related amidase